MEIENDIKDNKLSQIFQLVIPFFYLLIFFKNYIGEENKMLLLIITAIYILLGTFITIFFCYKLPKNSIIFLLITFLFLLSLLISFFSKNYRIEDNILVLTYFGIAFIPLNIKLNYSLYKAFIYIIILFFVFNIISGVNPNDIFVVSRNFISVLLLIGLGYYIISCFQNEKVPSLLIFILSLAISIWATGRGGIIVFSLLLFTYPFLVDIKLSSKLIILSGIMILSVLAYFYLYNILFEFGLGRFDDMGLEGDRTLMNTQYLSNAISSPFNMIFGCNLNEIPSILEVDNNPHNSFIRLHVYYGIIGFILIIFALTFSLLKYITKKEILYFVLLSAILLRSFLDSLAFHGPLDPLIYFLIFYTIRNYKLVK